MAGRVPGETGLGLGLGHGQFGRETVIESTASRVYYSAGRSQIESLYTIAKRDSSLIVPIKVLIVVILAYAPEGCEHER